MEDWNCTGKKTPNFSAAACCSSCCRKEIELFHYLISPPAVTGDTLMTSRSSPELGLPGTPQEALIYHE